MSEFKLLRKVLSKYSTPITISYPSSIGKKYSQIPDGLRGIPERDKDKCIGCKACYFICSGRATNVFDKENKRIIDIFLFRCTFCAHCQELCPEEAIKLTQNFEVVFFNESPQAHISTELELLTCKKCGRPYTTKRMLERTYERLIEKINPLVREIVSNDYKKAKDYCIDCRRALSIVLDIHTKKYVWLEVK
ncbi:MAG: 4Fe-4S dicluster domain-containing protein [Candidatus Verstraetearchaeota archaeon]|nr:4Fe-4S dicluster domain-containing protein [Candidatus Verstraetearchaeota archaeon]